MKKSALFLIFIVGTVVALAIGQVFVSNSLSTKGVLLAKLEDKISSYKRENTLLRERFLLASSLTNIASGASELGFVKEKEEVFLTSPLPLAIRQ